MQRKAGKIVIELTSTGGERLRKDLVALGPAGERALKRLDRATKSTAPGFRFLDNSVRELKGSISELETRAGPLGRILGGLGPAGKFAAVGIGAIAIAGAGALRVAQQATKAFDQMAKSADDLGLSTDSFQALKAASLQASVGFEQTEASLRQFTRASAEAATGRGELSEKLKNSHPELLKSIQLETTMEGKLNAVAKALGNATSEQERTLIATAAFGESGRSMIRVLGDQEDAIEGLISRAREMGLVVDESILRKSEKIATDLAIAAQVIDVQFKQALIDLAPVLQGTAKFAAELAKDIRGIVDAVKSLPSNPLEGLRALATGTAPRSELDILVQKSVEENKKLERIIAARDRLSDKALALQRNVQQGGAAGTLSIVPLEAIKLRLRSLDRQIVESETRLSSLETKGQRILDDRKPSSPTSPNSSGSGDSGEMKDYLKQIQDAAEATRRRAEEERLLAQIIADSLSPQERYRAELEKLNAIQDRLSDSQYAGALKELQDTRDKSIAQLEKEARLKARAADLTASLGEAVNAVLTPQQNYNQALADLNDLKPWLTTETYSARLRELKADLEAATQAEKDRLALIEDSKTVRESLLTDQERLNAEIERLGKLRSQQAGDGGLTDDEYSEAVKNAREEFDKLNRKGEDHIDILRRMSSGIGTNITSWRDFGRVALQALVEIGLQALRTKGQVDSIGGFGGGGNILGAIGSGIAGALGFSAESPAAAGSAAASTSAKIQPIQSKFSNQTMVSQAMGAKASGAASLSGAPRVNFTLVDNVGVRVEREERQKANGETELLIKLEKQIEKGTLRTLASPAGERVMRSKYALKPVIGAR